MPSMVEILNTFWTVGSGVYDYYQTRNKDEKLDSQISAMENVFSMALEKCHALEKGIHALEKRIRALENILSIHQFVIVGLILLLTYILWKKKH